MNRIASSWKLQLSLNFRKYQTGNDLSGLFQETRGDRLDSVPISGCLADLPADKCGTVLGGDPTPYVILALWAVNGLSIVCWALRNPT